MLNDIKIHGYLGRDPELKEYRNAKGETHSLCNLSVGVSRVGDGTDWFNVTFFGRKAEVVDKFFRKGSQIIVMGRMQNDTYEKDGQKRSSWKLMANDFDFCDSQGSPRATGNTAAQGTEDLPDNFEAAENDIPF